MIPFSPSATAILADLQLLGIDVKPRGDVIRCRPWQAMTPALLQRLQAHKAELLAMLMIQQVHDSAPAGSGRTGPASIGKSRGLRPPPLSGERAPIWLGRRGG